MYQAAVPIGRNPLAIFIGIQSAKQFGRQKMVINSVA